MGGGRLRWGAGALGLSAALVVAGCGGPVATTAQPAQGGDSRAGVQLEPAAAQPGAPVSVSGSACLLDGRATDNVIVALSRLAGPGQSPFDTTVRYPVRPDGRWAGRLVVPAPAPPGRYTVSATCAAGDQVMAGVESAFTVLPGAGSPSTADVATVEPARTSDGGPEPVVRSRLVVLDPTATSGRSFDLVLFDDIVVHLVATERDGGPHNLAWRGRVEQAGVVAGAATLSVVDGSLFATIVLVGAGDDRVFRIEPAGGGASLISEFGPAAPAQPEPSGAAGEPPTPGGPTGDPAADTAPAGPTIGVLVVFTPRARRAVPDIGALIAAAVNDTNSAYANSGIGQRITLAGVEEVGYAEGSQDLAVDLGRLQRNGDGFLDDVHALRDAVGADLVSLWGDGYTSACGLGYLQNPVAPAFAPFGFSAMHVRCQNYTFAHELGHNLGARHDWDNDSRTGPFTYNHGHIDHANDFRTIMAYDSGACPGGSCARIPHFSNPEVTWSGRPTGVPAGEARAADNRQTFANTGPVVAAFRADGPPQKAPADFDGDGRTDIAVYRPATGEWLVRGRPPVTWGEAGDIPVPADYDGDGRTDIAVYRPATGEWFVMNQATVQWGVPGDVPAVADYDGDGRSEPAVFRPSTQAWWVSGRLPVVWGEPGDLAVPGDFDLDGRADLVVFRPGDGRWAVRGQFSSVWGEPGDLPVPGDFGGDGRSDMAVFRPSAGQWWVRGRGAPLVWGIQGDVPVPGDFDGDRDADVAVYRASTGEWWLRGAPTVQWGLPGDVSLVLAPSLQVALGLR